MADTLLHPQIHSFRYWCLHRGGILIKFCWWWVHTPGSSEKNKRQGKWHITLQSKESTETWGSYKQSSPSGEQGRAWDSTCKSSKKTETWATFCLCLLKTSICEVKSHCQAVSPWRVGIYGWKKNKAGSRHDSKTAVRAVLFTISTST